MYFGLQKDPDEDNKGVVQASEPASEEVQERVMKEGPDSTVRVSVTD